MESSTLKETYPPPPRLHRCGHGLWADTLLYSRLLPSVLNRLWVAYGRCVVLDQMVVVVIV